MICCPDSHRIEYDYAYSMSYEGGQYNKITYLTWFSISVRRLTYSTYREYRHVIIAEALSFVRKHAC